MAGPHRRGLRGFGEQVGGRGHVVLLDAVSAQRADRGVGPHPQRVGRRRDVPRRRQRLGDPDRREVVEGRGDHLGRDLAERRGPGGEISHPEAAVPQAVERCSDFGREIDDTVYRLETIEKAPCQRGSSVHPTS
jgi:hypothetical protein